MNKKIPLPYLLILSFFPFQSAATSFTSFSLADQIQKSQYLVLGEILEENVRLEKISKIPHTYWKLLVKKSFFPLKNLEKEIEIRQAGGKLGDIQYSYFGTVNFKKGENVILLLQDTQETAKNIVGMLAGKYTLQAEKGKKILYSALGGRVENQKGEALSLKQFHMLVKDIQLGKIPNDRFLIRGEEKNTQKHGRHYAGHGFYGKEAQIRTLSSTNAIQRAEEKESLAPQNFHLLIAFTLLFLALGTSYLVHPK